MTPRERILALRLIEKHSDQRELIDRLVYELKIKETPAPDGQRREDEKGGNPHAD